MSLKETLARLAAVAARHDLGEPFICGGVARDLQLGEIKELHDVDITTGRSDVGLLADLFAGETGASVKTFADGHKQVFVDGVHIDFSTNFKYPDIDAMLEEAGAELTDLNREMWSRDFTINALLLKLDLSQTLDPTGMGLEDVKTKLLRCPLDPMVSFAASPNRLVRAWEYAGRLGFDFDPKLKEAIEQSLELLKKVKPRYAGAKLNAALRKRPELLDEMIEMGVLNHVPHTKLITKMLIQKRRLLDVMNKKTASEKPIYPFMELVDRNRADRGVPGPISERFTVGGIPVSLHANAIAYSRPREEGPNLHAADYDLWELRIDGVEPKFLKGSLPAEIWDEIDSYYTASQELIFGYVPADLVQETWYALEKNGHSIIEDQKIAEEQEGLDKKTPIPIAKQAKLPSSHPYPRIPVFRRNLDLGEGFSRMTDEFRAGEIGGVSDYVEKLRKKPPVIKDLYERRKRRKKKIKKSSTIGIEPEFNLDLPDDFIAPNHSFTGRVIEDNEFKRFGSPIEAIQWARSRIGPGKTVEAEFYFTSPAYGGPDIYFKQHPELYRNVKPDELMASDHDSISDSRLQNIINIDAQTGIHSLLVYTSWVAVFRFRSTDGNAFEKLERTVIRSKVLYWYDLDGRETATTIDVKRVGPQIERTQSKTASINEDYTKQPFEEAVDEFGNDLEVGGIYVHLLQPYKELFQEPDRWDLLVMVEPSKLAQYIPSSIMVQKYPGGISSSTSFRYLSPDQVQVIIDALLANGHGILEDKQIEQDQAELRRNKQASRQLPSTTNAHVLVSVRDALDPRNPKFIDSQKFDQLRPAFDWAEQQQGPGFKVSVVADLYDEPEAIKTPAELSAKLTAGTKQLRPVSQEEIAEFDLAPVVKRSLARATSVGLQSCRSARIELQSLDNEPMKEVGFVERHRRLLFWDDRGQIFQVWLPDEKEGQK